MIRTRQEIERDRQRKKEFLEEAINEKARAEDFYDNETKMLQNQLRELDAESCFEDTSAGQIQMLEQEAKKRINLIFKEMSQKTGRSYPTPYEITKIIDEYSELTDEHLEVADEDKA